MIKGFFDKAAITDGELCRDVGQTSKRPFIIKAAVRETSLGDLASKVACLASLKNQFDFAELHIRFRDVRPYSKEMISLVPNLDSSKAVKWDVPVWARLGIPDSRLWHPLARSIDGRKGSWNSFCDFYPTDWMLNPRWLHALPNPMPLKVPEDRCPELMQQLVDLGLDRDRWFVVIHYRASTYLSKTSGVLRNGDPDAQRKLIDHVIDRLGGQAVLLGHPELEAFPARPGFVDLSRLPHSFMLQAYASSNARFMVAGPSGPIALGWALQIPTAMVDLPDAIGGWGSAVQCLLTYEVTTPNGRKLQNRELFESGLLDYRLLRDKIRAGENYQVRKNSSEELIAVTNYLHSATSDVEGWRPPVEPSGGPKPNHFVWPPQTGENLNFFDVAR